MCELLCDWCSSWGLLHGVLTRTLQNKHTGAFRSFVKLDCVSPGSKYSPKESEDKKLV